MRESLSLNAQQWYDRQDYDSVFLPWQIPLDHKSAFDELISKGYLVKATTGANLQGYVFAADIVSSNTLGELNAPL